MRTPNPVEADPANDAELDDSVDDTLPVSHRADARIDRTSLLLEQRRQRILARSRLSH